MRRIVIAIASTISALVLLFSYRTSTGDSAGLTANGPIPAGTADTPATQSTGTQNTGTSSPSGSTSSTATTGNGSGATTGSFTGGAAQTQYGPVQVRISVSSGKIVSANAVQVPQESDRDVRINSQAVPILNEEAVQAQSAQIDAVSGATYTSQGYVRSLQSAIDAAHL
jgi:uncharacterized protein with FMN-binding domain